MDPSVSNNFIYQQDVQIRQQAQLQPRHPNAGLLATTPTVASLATAGGQQRYVGGLNYAMQQPHANNYHQMRLSHNPIASTLTPSRSYIPNQAPPNVFTKQPSLYSSSMLFNDGRSRVVSDMVLQPDTFRRLSGITSEVFRQIEAVEAQFDPSTLAAQYAEMERRGEMIIRILNPTSILPAWLEDTIHRYGDGISLPSWVQFVEIIKRPGQTLGLYIREGDAIYTTEGVYISRIALESPVYQSGCLRVGDEILAVNMVDVQRMSLDDVVIVMSIPRRLILTIRSRPLNVSEHILPSANRQIYGHTLGPESYYDTVASDIYSRVDELRKPVVVLKQQLTAELDEEEEEEVLAAATAAAQAGLLDDPGAAAAAAVAALNNPTPATAAAAVAAVNQLNASRTRSCSLDMYDLDFKRCTMGARPLANRRKLFANTADNLAAMYHNSTLDDDTFFTSSARRRSGSMVYDRPHSRMSTSSALLPLNKSARSEVPVPSLYHGRLMPRGRSSTGRLLRTSSEQMLFGDNLSLEPHSIHASVRTSSRRLSLSGAASGSDDQMDYFLQRYNSLRQMQKRHSSLERSGMRNSYSSQTLGPSGSNFQRRLEALGIPLPAMAEMAARNRRSQYGGGSISDNETSIYDILPRRSITPSLLTYGSRSNSLPRTGLHTSMYGRSGRTGNLSQRLQQLESLYQPTTSKRHTLSTGRVMPSRPHSAIGNYYSENEDDNESIRMRRNLGNFFQFLIAEHFHLSQYHGGVCLLNRPSNLTTSPTPAPP